MIRGILSIVVLSVMSGACASGNQQESVSQETGQIESVTSDGELFHPLPIYEYVDYSKEGTISDELDKLSKGRSYYRKAAEKHYSANYGGSDTSFLGSIIGLVGGATKSVETVVLGGVMGAGGEIVPSRYQLDQQAGNYFALAKTYDCMIKAVMNHEGLAEITAAKPAEQPMQIGSSEKRVVTHIARLKENLNFRLFERQQSVTLLDVSTDKLKNALSQLNTNKITPKDQIEKNGLTLDQILLQKENNLKSLLTVCAAEY